MELKGPPDFRATVAQTEAFARMSARVACGLLGCDQKLPAGIEAPSVTEVAYRMPKIRDDLRERYAKHRADLELKPGQFTLPLSAYPFGGFEPVADSLLDFSAEGKCTGLLMGVMVGDILGAPFEGWNYELIRERMHCPFGVIHFFPGTHMGAREHGYRYGMYTDDSLQTLALADSIVTEKGVDAKKAALNYAKWWKTRPHYTGLPQTAQVPLEKLWSMKDTILASKSKSETSATAAAVMSEEKTGDALVGDELDAYIAGLGRANFADGSWANGGAMRIGSVACAYRNAPMRVLKKAIVDAILTSHVHFEALDGALCVCIAIRHALKSDAHIIGSTATAEHVAFDFDAMIEECIANVATDKMKQCLAGVKFALQQFTDKKLEGDNLDSIFELDIELLRKFKLAADSSSGDDASVMNLLNFQIKSVEAISLVFYCLGRWWRSPQQCIVNTVTLGGDCDTTASILGAIIGALHGYTWIPQKWMDVIDNERGEDHHNYGRERAFELGMGLAELDIVEHSMFSEDTDEWHSA